MCVCFCLWVCKFVCGSVTTITPNCVHRSSPNRQIGFVSKGSDHLQLIKFRPSCAAGKGVCGGANFFGSALLQPARSVLRCPLVAFIRYHWIVFISKIQSSSVNIFKNHLQRLRNTRMGFHGLKSDFPMVTFSSSYDRDRCDRTRVIWGDGATSLLQPTFTSCPPTLCCPIFQKICSF